MFFVIERFMTHKVSAISCSSCVGRVLKGLDLRRTNWHRSMTGQPEIGFWRGLNLLNRVSAARLMRYHHSVPAATIQIEASGANFGVNA